MATYKSVDTSKVPTHRCVRGSARCSSSPRGPSRAPVGLLDHSVRALSHGCADCALQWDVLRMLVGHLRSTPSTRSQPPCPTLPDRISHIVDRPRLVGGVTPVIHSRCVSEHVTAYCAAVWDGTALARETAPLCDLCKCGIAPATERRPWSFVVRWRAFGEEIVRRCPDRHVPAVPRHYRWHATKCAHAGEELRARSSRRSSRKKSPTGFVSLPAQHAVVVVWLQPHRRSRLQSGQRHSKVDVLNIARRAPTRRPSVAQSL